MRAGCLNGLSWRPAQGKPVRADSLRLLAGVGIAGDLHADALSPRQLLLASASTYDDLDLPPQALRENLLLDLDTSRLASGTVLQIGDAVRLRLMFQCEACGQLDSIQPRLAARIGTRRGVLARVLAGGTIRGDDRILDLGVLEPPWHDDWRERIRRVLDVVPAGAVIEYRHLARLAGIQSSYCRAFPRLVAKLGDDYAAKAVAAQSAVKLPRWEGAGLFDLY